MELDKIITGDSAVVLQSFPPDCIDLTVTSPPYDNLRTYNGFVFDFETIARELFRVTKVGGVVVWIVNDAVINGSETGTSFRQALYFMQCGFNLHDTMFYEAVKPPANDNRYQQSLEYMFVFSKGNPKSVNLLIDKKNNWAGTKNFGTRTQRDTNGNLKEGSKSVVPQYSRRLNVWKYSTGKGYSASDEYAHEHPAIFPEALAQDHILSWSNEGDTVLDCFTGSGTTLKMAKMLNRHYIGIEISPEYVTLAEKRLLATPTPLFGLGRGLTLPAPDGGDSAPQLALSTPEVLSPSRATRHPARRK